MSSFKKSPISGFQGASTSIGASGASLDFDGFSVTFFVTDGLSLAFGSDSSLFFKAILVEFLVERRAERDESDPDSEGTQETSGCKELNSFETNNLFKKLLGSRLIFYFDFHRSLFLLGVVLCGRFFIIVLNSG